MSIVRFDLQNFFLNLGKNIDSNEVKCFKCDNPLYYKSSSYKCLKNHIYSYQEVIFKYSLHLENIKDELGIMGGCSLQSVDFV